MSDLVASGAGEPPPSYMIFLVVFLFFLTGLLGFLICHMLKQKGYRCRAGDMEDEEEEEKLGANADDEYEGNQDTVEQILKCIIENEANMEAFNELLGNHNICVRHDPRLRKESIAGIPPHLHTVHSGADLNSCHLCAQVQSKKGRRQSRTLRFKQRPGEQTVFSVGRFRVTHTDKKLLGGPAPLAASGDHLDRSQDSEDRKDAEYNIRSMFREAWPPSEGINGASSAGKRKKSVSIFGLRRGSDPIGIKAKPGVGREIADFKFAVHHPPVVLEEPPQAENIGEDRESTTNPASKLEVQAVLAKNDPQKPGLDNSPSIQREDYKSDSDPQEHHKIMTQSSTGNTVALAPSYLPILSERTVNVENNVAKTKEICDPGPLQTSTPISPVPASIPSVASSVPAHQSQHRSTKVFSISQSPPDLSSSSDVEPGFGAGLRFISLGSSPPSSTTNKTLSSVSLVKTPTSSLAESPSPKSNLSREVEKANFSSTSLPSLPGGPEKSDQEPNLSAGFVQNLSCIGSTHSESLTQFDHMDIHSSSKNQQSETDKISKTEGKMEIRRPGILKTSKYSPASGHSSPSDQASKDRLSMAASSPSLTLSPLLPHGSRTSHVTVVKASPDSKREFSVVTMVEDREIASEQEDISVSAGAGAESQSRDTLESTDTQIPKKDLARGNNETETLEESEE